MTRVARPDPGAGPRRYWQAQGLADDLYREFAAAKARRDAPAMRDAFYLLARYYGRTLAILRRALRDGPEHLIVTALRNLTALHRPLHHMHDLAPTRVPLALTLDRHHRRVLVEDLVIEALQEAGRPLALPALTDRVNELHLLGQVDEATVAEHLGSLVAGGHLAPRGDRWERTRRPYDAVNLDRAALEALLGPEPYARFQEAGFHDLADVEDRPHAFREFFQELTGCGAATADLLLAAARELLAPPSLVPELGAGAHADLIGAVHSRPYQRDAFAVFRGHGYRGQVIEAPTGSGKTLVGMMCLQDWLRGMAPGELALVLVPTVNYQQQWVGELCHKPIGLRLPPDAVYAGTPTGLEAAAAESGATPVVLVLTYAALAQVGSAAGKGGFDQGAIERFLQAYRVQYAILDECHKVVENLGSVSAAVTRSSPSGKRTAACGAWWASRAPPSPTAAVLARWASTSSTPCRPQTSSPTASSPPSPSSGCPSPTPTGSSGYAPSWRSTRPSSSSSSEPWGVRACGGGGPRCPWTTGWPWAATCSACTPVGPAETRRWRTGCGGGRPAATSGSTSWGW
ncbi:MAG: DEAD/DEAH box helicase [Deferrisomatales bacterium]